MKIKVINTMSNTFDVDLHAVPRIGELLDDNEVLSVNYLIDSDYVAEIKIKTSFKKSE